ncbi:MAG: hypothetical protein RSD83_00760 [Hafnia sp.]|uniref:hypothetical protein n=1 Tax=Hafnia TaxID=568 RepID=UPI002FC7A98B
MATYTYKYGKILDEIKAQQSFVRLSIDKVFSTISGHIRTRYINRQLLAMAVYYSVKKQILARTINNMYGKSYEF